MAILNIQPMNITWSKKDASGGKSYRRIDNVIDINAEKALSILTYDSHMGYSDEIIYACYKILLDKGYLKYLRNHDYKRPILVRALDLRSRGII